MFALVNTMNTVSTEIGSVISYHRSQEAAEQANARLQRLTKRSSGSSSYLPTTIVELSANPGPAKIHPTVWPSYLARRHEEAK